MESPTVRQLDYAERDEITESKPRPPQRKHTYLGNLWLTIKLSLKDFLISVLTQDTYLRTSVIKR
jgi:hypothetical protein